MSRTRNTLEVFRAFFVLGCMSFGGPVAHIGYFREEFVRRRAWLDDTRFGQLLAACQFLPGPTSSQMGFAIGLFRGGWLGAVAAFVGFTLPSAIMMFGCAALAPRFGQGDGAAVVRGLKLVAVAVVAHALVGMVRHLAPDAARAGIAAAAAMVVLSGESGMALAAIVLGGVLGLRACRHVQAPGAAMFTVHYGRRTAMVFAGLFAAGLGLALLAPSSGEPTLLAVAGAFYRAGAMVFGGGHVVLPLLHDAVVGAGWVDDAFFVSGYGAAQAVPGPLFSFAAFLGAGIPLDAPPAVGAAVALLAMFLPGLLLLLAVLPAWARLARHPWAAAGMAGVNAAVVGLLAAAFIDPVLVQGLRAPADGVIAAVAFGLLAAARVSALWAVLWCVGAALAMAQAA